jgi:hypothetical protein
MGNRAEEKDEKRVEKAARFGFSDDIADLFKHQEKDFTQKH